MAVGFPTKSNWAAGDVLTAAQMDDLAGTVNLLQNSAYPIVAGKNGLINGGFDIWQRGTTSLAANGYTADRWYLLLNSGTGTCSQDSSNVVAGSNYSLKFTSTTAGWPILIQAIETANSLQFAGKTVNFSLYVATSTSVNVDIYVQYSTSTDNSVSGTYTTAFSSLAVATTSTLTQKTLSGAIPSTARTIRVLIQTSAAMANAATLTLGQAQLELGTVPTTFTRAGGTIQQELAACQRYYVRIGDTNGASNQRLARGSANSTTGIQLTATLPVQLRTGASSTIDYANLQWYNGLGGVGAISSVTMSATSTTNPAIAAVTTGVVSGTFYELLTTSTAGYIGFSAEL